MRSSKQVMSLSLSWMLERETSAHSLVEEVESCVREGGEEEERDEGKDEGDEGEEDVGDEGDADERTLKARSSRSPGDGACSSIYPS